jgi:hypothetical protein
MPGQPGDVDLFNAAWAEPTGGGGSFSFTGIITIPSGDAPAALSLGCYAGSNGDKLNNEFTSWWVSPVATMAGSTVSQPAQSTNRG